MLANDKTSNISIKKKGSMNGMLIKYETRSKSRMAWWRGMHPQHPQWCIRTCQNCIFYRHPCVATVADYVLLLFIFYFFIFYSPFVLRNYTTDFRKIFRNSVFWCSLNNPVVLNLFWHHLAEINAKKQPIFAQNFKG